MDEIRPVEAVPPAEGLPSTGIARDQGEHGVVSTGSESTASPQQQAAQGAGASVQMGQGATLDPALIVAHSGPHAPQNQRQWQNIPQEKRKLPQWCVAAPSHLPDKRPYQCNGYPASVSDPSTWTTFDRAAEYAHRHGANIGFVLTPDDDLAVIDFDVKAETTQEQLDGFAMLINGLNSYTELSRSGRGVHVWVRGVVGAGCRRDGVELYDRERFMICTGNVIKGYPLTIEPRQEAIDWMRPLMSARAGHSVPLVEVEPTRTDEAVWAALIRHEKFASKILPLCEGRWSELGYPSPSEADHALISYMANSTQSNEQVRRMFRQTKLAHCHRPSGNTGKHSKGDYHINVSLKGIRAEQVARMNAIQTLAILKPPAA